jgi:hypothetical protein
MGWQAVACAVSKGVTLDLEKMKSRIGARLRAPNVEYATS